MRRITSNILQAFEHHPCILAVNTVSTNLINNCCKVYCVKKKEKKRKEFIIKLSMEKWSLLYPCDQSVLAALCTPNIQLYPGEMVRRIT